MDSNEILKSAREAVCQNNNRVYETLEQYRKNVNFRMLQEGIIYRPDLLKHMNPELRDRLQNKPPQDIQDLAEILGGEVTARYKELE